MSSATVTTPTAIVISGTATNVLCYAGTTGAINITVTGGTGAYTYNWGSGVTTEDRTNLIAGEYTVIVTDANGCTATQTYNISQPSVLTLSNTKNDILCYGATDGNISLTISGGVSGYSYVWKNSANTTVGNNQNLNNISAGTYNVTVTDANGCSNALNSIVISQPSLFTVSASVLNNVSCYDGSNGSVSVLGAGGTTGYTYLWSNGVSDKTVTSLKAGSYNVTATDANGCTASSSISISQPIAPIKLYANVTDSRSCAGTPSGAIDLIVENGNGTLSYIWNGPTSIGTNIQDPTQLEAGTYSVNVNDAIGCTATLTKNIGLAPTLIVTVNGFDKSCAINPDGSAYASVVGGVTPYTYSWSNTATTQSISNLNTGTYSVVVTDANGCTSTASTTLNAPICDRPLAIPDEFVTTSKSIINSVATNDIDIAFAKTDLQYQMLKVPNTDQGILTSALNGDFEFAPTKGYNGTVQLPYMVSNPLGLSSKSVLTIYISQLEVTEKITKSSCGQNGAISISVTGGFTNLSYQWTGANGYVSNNKDIVDLVPGEYNLIITDAKGATHDYTYVIPDICYVDDVNSTLINLVITGNLSTNDLISTGTTYGQAQSNSSNPTGASINILDDGRYTFSATSPGKFIYYVPICSLGQTSGCPLSTLTIIVDNVLPSPPSNLKYETPNTYIKGRPIAILNPIVTGNISGGFTVSPNLPIGLKLDAALGTISGTPIEASGATNYTVTVKNSGGSTSAVVNLKVFEEASAIISGSATICTSTSTDIRIQLTGTAPWSLSYSDGTITTTVSNIVSSPYIFSVTPAVNKTYTITALSDANASSASMFGSAIISVNQLSNGGIITGAGTIYSGVNTTVLKLTNYEGVVSQWQSSSSSDFSNNVLNIPNTTNTLTVYNIDTTTFYRAIVTNGVCLSSISTIGVIEFINAELLMPNLPVVVNATYTWHALDIPLKLSALVKSYPINTVPAWCDSVTNICDSISPKMPENIGRYVYLLKSLDTLNQLYSKGYAYDTVLIKPLVPKAIDSSYIVGLKTNPANVSLHVTGLPSSTINYFVNHKATVNIPTIPTTAGVYNYQATQTYNNVESDTSSFKLNMFNLNDIIHLQKIVDSSILQSNSTFNIPFKFVATNLTKYPIQNVVISDNLLNSVNVPSEFSMISKSAIGGLNVNTSFNGNNNIDLTLNTSKLAPFAKDSAQFLINFIPNGFNGTLYNSATIKATTIWGDIEMVSSSLTKQQESTKRASPYYVPDLQIHIPEGFSPNNDGVNDYFVIIRPYNVKLDIEIFNRWGNVVYSKLNYMNDWNGKVTNNFIGQDVVDGGYYYTIKATDYKGGVQSFKGFIIIQR